MVRVLCDVQELLRVSPDETPDTPLRTQLMTLFRETPSHTLSLDFPREIVSFPPSFFSAILSASSTVSFPLLPRFQWLVTQEYVEVPFFPPFSAAPPGDLPAGPRGRLRGAAATFPPSAGVTRSGGKNAGEQFSGYFLPGAFQRDFGPLASRGDDADGAARADRLNRGCDQYRGTAAAASAAAFLPRGFQVCRHAGADRRGDETPVVLATRGQFRAVCQEYRLFLAMEQMVGVSWREMTQGGSGAIRSDGAIPPSHLAVRGGDGGVGGKIRVGGKNTAVGVRTGGDGAIHSDAAGARCK